MNGNYLQIPSLTNPLMSPWDQYVASMASSPAASGSGLGPLPYLAAANMLLNPPQGPADMMQVGSPMQGGQPIVTQVQPWGAPAASGAMQGAMAGSMFGPPGMAIGARLGYGSGKK